MKLRPLIIDTDSRNAIAAVCAYAEANRVLLKQLVRSIANPELAPGILDERFNCVVPFGYFCTFTIEEQPAGWCRHLSLSVPAKGRLPNNPAIQMLLGEFGFRGGIEDTTYWLEDLGDGCSAINLVQPLDFSLPAPQSPPASGQ